jgi:transmembrane sensor
MSADEDPPDNPRDAAIDWVLRKKEGALSRAERAAFEAWLAADPARKAAYEDIVQLSADLSALGPEHTDTARPRRRYPLLALATTMAATAAVLFLLFDDLSALLLSDHSTGTGETEQLVLEDGSLLELGPKSAIALHYTPAERRLTLLQGEAWFSAVPNPTRPFVVEAAAGTVTALGTSFDIALNKSETLVTVTEHRVAIETGGQKTIVPEGQQSSFVPDKPAQPPAPADVERLTAWRRGKLIADDEPLSDVLAALSRYRHGFVYCLRPAICARRVSGVFGMDDPLQALNEIEKSLGLGAIRLSNFLIVLYD